MKLFLTLKAHYGSQAKYKSPQIWKGWEIWLISNILTQSWAHCSVHCQPWAINTTSKSCQNSFPLQAFWRTFWASWRVQMSRIRSLQRSLWGNFGASNQDTFPVLRRGGILGTSNGEETLGARSELLQVLYISSAPGTFPDSPGGASGSWLNWQNTCTYSLYVGATVTKARVECGARRERCNGGQ